MSKRCLLLRERLRERRHDWGAFLLSRPRFFFVGNDGALLLNGPLAATTIEIVDPPHPTEYHALGALTDADGYYSCDGIASVAALDLKASAAGFVTPAAPVSRILNYNLPTNVVDFRL